MSLSKNGGTDANHGRALTDRDRKVVRHPHRKVALAEAARLLLFELVAQFAQLDEIRARPFGLVKKWREGHQTVDPDSFEPGRRGNNFPDLVGVGAEFGRFVSEVYLNQDGQRLPQLPGGTTEPSGQLDAVEGVYDIEQLRCPACFVRLEVAYKMPLEMMPAAQGINLRFCFLNPVLAEAALASGNGQLDCFGGERLADSDKCHAVLRTSCGSACAGYELSHFREVLSDIHHEFGVELEASLCYSPIGILDIFPRSSKGSGMFITFEGIEGSGKSLQIGRVKSYLESRGIECLVTREPGGTVFGQAVRRILLGTGGAPREPMSELLLYLADRCQHLHEIVKPALDRGITVLSDRYHDATRAYQGAARGIPIDQIDCLAQLLRIPEPDGTVLLDLDPQVGLARARQRNASDSAVGSEGRFEAEELAFHRAVREAYLDLARRSAQRIRIVPANGTPDEVFARIVPLLELWFAHAG